MRSSGWFGLDELVPNGKGTEMIIDFSVLNISTTYAGSITFLNETAGFKNAFGMYKINDQGAFYDVTVIFGNSSASDSGGYLIRGASTYETIFSETDRLGFFLAPHAAGNDYLGLLVDGGTNYVLRNASGEIASLDDTAPISLFHVSDTGAETMVWAKYSSRTWHSTAEAGNSFALNGDNTDHTIWDLQVEDGTLKLDMRFEDLLNGGDRDFLDIVFRLDVGPENTMDSIDSGKDPSTVLTTADRVVVAEGQTVVFDPLANDTGVDLTITHLNEQAVSIGDSITLGDGEIVTLLQGGQLRIEGSGSVSDFDKVMTYAVVDAAGATDGTVIAIVTPVAVLNSDVLVTARGETNINLLDYVPIPPGTTLTVTQIDGQAAVVGQVYQLASGTSATYQGNGVLSLDGADITSDAIDALSYTMVDDTGVISSNTLSITTSPVDGTSGSDTLVTPGQSDAQGNMIDGGDGLAEVIMGYGGSDLITAGAGDDAIYGGDGSDTINGGLGNDDIYGNDESDNLTGGAGDDRIEGGAGSDNISGGTGDDIIDAGPGTDNVSGGDGNDTIYGGGDNDTLTGDADRDTFIINQLGNSGINSTSVNGSSTGDDYDTLNVSPLLAQGWSITSLAQNPEFNGNPGFNGQMQLANGGQTATINFTDIEDIIVCFTPGTWVDTPKGLTRVEDLRPGDAVQTRDNGMQRIVWSGQRSLGTADLRRNQKLNPILICKDALGKDAPNRDMMVSPNHRVLLVDAMADMMFGEPEILIAAKFLTDLPGVSQTQPIATNYIHFMFEQHEVVRGDGLWSESFQPGDYSLRGIDEDSRAELLDLFPELGTKPGLASYAAARLSLKSYEAAVFLSGARLA